MMIGSPITAARYSPSPLTRPLLIACVVFLQPLLGSGWLLAQVGLNETYHVLHLSTFYNRVFLTIQVQSKTFPTLIESEWPESFLPVWSMVFPHMSMHSTSKDDDRINCKLIQQARWSQTDNLSRLWVLDIGWRGKRSKCPPKLLAFDLLRSNALVSKIDCGKFLQPEDEQLLHITLAPIAYGSDALLQTASSSNSCDQSEKFVYFIRSNDPHLYAYDLMQHKWLKWQLFSEKYAGIREIFAIQPMDFTFDLQGQLLLSDDNGILYTKEGNGDDHVDNNNNDIVPNLMAVVRPSTPEDDRMMLTVIGNLLGPSKAMMIEPSTDVLYYVVPKFGAIVRCDYKRNLTTEGNEVVYMSAKNIQQIFFDSDNSLWLLSERALSPKDHCYMPRI